MDKFFKQKPEVELFYAIPNFLDWFEAWIDKSVSQLENQLKESSSKNKYTDSQTSLPFWKKLFS